MTTHPRVLPPLPPDDLAAVAVADVVPWRELAGARLFLSGGTGFFGSWLVESFVAANRRHALDARLTVLSRDPERFLARAPHLRDANELTFRVGDVREICSNDDRYTHVIHAATAASAQLNAEAPLEMLDTVIDGTRRVLDIAVKSGARRFLFTSSGAIYGPQPSTVSHVEESFPQAPDPLRAADPYGNGKRLAEHLCQLYGAVHGLEVVHARAFAFVGPHLPLDTHFAVGNFLRDAMAGRSVQVGGDGTPLRSYLYAADLTTWLWALLLRGAPGQAYNVGSDEAVSIAQLAQVVAETVGDGRFSIAKEPLPGAPVARYVPSTRKAREQLGLAVTVPLPEALRRTAAWWRSVDG